MANDSPAGLGGGLDRRRGSAMRLIIRDDGQRLCNDSRLRDAVGAGCPVIFGVLSTPDGKRLGFSRATPPKEHDGFWLTGVEMDDAKMLVRSYRFDRGYGIDRMVERVIDLNGLNYDDRALKEAVATLKTRLDTLWDGSASEAIDTFREIKAFLAGITDSETLEGILGGIAVQIAQKADRSEAGDVTSEDTGDEIEDIAPGIVANALLKTEQTLTEEERRQVKVNLGISKTELFAELWRGLSRNGRIVYGYDDERGLFSVNHCSELLRGYDFDDITPDEAVLMYNARCCGGDINGTASAGSLHTARTNVHLFNYANPVVASANLFTGYNASIQVVNLCGWENTCTGLRLADVASNCASLRAIVGICLLTRESETSVNAPALEWLDFSVSAAVRSISLADSPLLRVECLQRSVGRIPAASVHPQGLTITVHPEVFAKLTDETDASWFAVMTEAAEKNISFAK